MTEQEQQEELEAVLDEVVAYAKRNCGVEGFAAAVGFAALARSGHSDFILLSNDNLRSWWARVLDLSRKRIAARELKRRKDAALASAVSKLSNEERLALGLRLPTKKKSP